MSIPFSKSKWLNYITNWQVTTLTRNWKIFLSHKQEVQITINWQKGFQIVSIRKVCQWLQCLCTFRIWGTETLFLKKKLWHLINIFTMGWVTANDSVSGSIYLCRAWSIKNCSFKNRVFTVSSSSCHCMNKYF